jgi:hypothetical protein
VGAAVLVGLEGLFFVGLAVLELASLSRGRLALGLTTALFFLAMGAGLLMCARGLLAVRSWARSPVVATQLIGLLLAYSFWGGETTLAALAILGVSAAVLVAVLHPASTRALAVEGDGP